MHTKNQVILFVFHRPDNTLNACYPFVYSFRSIVRRYFAFANDFLNGTISLRQLEEAMYLGKPGEQVVLFCSREMTRGPPPCHPAVYLSSVIILQTIVSPAVCNSKQIFFKFVSILDRCPVKTLKAQLDRTEARSRCILAELTAFPDNPRPRTAGHLSSNPAPDNPTWTF